MGDPGSGPRDDADREDAAPMERAVQIYAIVNLTVIGLSHVARPRAWVNFFVVLRERGEAGVLAVALLNLVFGSIIVAFHNVWSGIPMVLTIIGWAQVIKGLTYFCFPEYGLKRISYVQPERAYLYSIAGVVALGLAGLLAFDLWRRSGG